MPTTQQSQIASQSRPVVYDYATPPAFLRALHEYYRSQGAFSIRERLKETKACSPSLVTLVLKEKRRLRRDLLPAFAEVFSLTPTELDHLDGLLCAHSPLYKSKAHGLKDQERPARNHLLKDWLNVYVKDCIHLKGFKPETATLFRLLGGIASPSRIQRSIDFLLKEGFWRKTPRGEVVPDDSAVRTTSGVSVPKIRQFHKAALELAKKGLDRYPPERRKAYATVISVERDSLDELKTLIDRFHKDLQDFIEEHPEGDDQLCQVTIHMTPIGGFDVEST